MNKRVRVTVSLLLALIFLVLTACSSGGSNSNPGNGNENTASEANDSPFANAPVFNIDMQCFNMGTQMERTLRPTIELIRASTEGTVNITLYDSGVLFPTTDVLNVLSTGDLASAFMIEGTFSGAIPVTKIASGTPYAFPDLHESFVFMFERGFREILVDAYAEFNVYPIPFDTQETGLLTRDPVYKLDDLKGMKLRASGTFNDWLAAVGASPAMISGPELYTAMSQGVVTGGAWGASGTMYEMRMHETTSYYMWPNPGSGQWNSIMFNIDVWNNFTPAQRLAIEYSIGRARHTAQELVAVGNARALEIFQKDFGITVIELPEEELVKAREASVPIYDALAAQDARSAEVVAKLRAFWAEREEEANIYTSVREILEW